MNYQQLSNILFQQADKLLSQYKNLFTEEECQSIKQLQFELAISDFEDGMQLKSFELSLLPFLARIWTNELTEPDMFQVGDSFNFVVCNPSHVGDYAICGNLVTDKNITNLDTNNYGLICDVNEDNLVFATNEDVSFHLIPSSSAMAYFYSLLYDFGDKFLMSPDYKIGLNFLNDVGSSKNNVILNSQNTKFNKVVLFEPCTASDLENALNLAKQYDLDIIKIPLELYKSKKR